MHKYLATDGCTREQSMADYWPGVGENLLA